MQPGTFKYLVSYSRIGAICYLGHLEFLQVIFRGLRRANIRTNFSKGYNPSPRVSFSPALPVGTESLCETFVMELPVPLENCKQTAQTLTDALPDGITITSIAPAQSGIPQHLEASYTIVINPGLSDIEKSRIELFLSRKHWMISRTRKGKVKEIDIRPMVSSLSLQSDSSLAMSLITRSGSPGINPLSALEHILGRNREDLITACVKKTAWTPIKE